MNIIAKFYGIVNEFNNPPAISYVTLRNLRTGEELNTDTVSEKLMERGINKEDCEFEVSIIENPDGKHELIIEKLEPNTMTPERLEEIKKEFEGRWTFTNDFNEFSI